MGRLTSSSSGGNVSIVGGGNQATVNADGSLDVHVVGGTNSANLSAYAESDNIAIGASVDVLTYTVPMGQTLKLNRINLSSDNISSFLITVDGITNGVIRLSYGTSYNASFNYEGLELAAGTVLVVNATNFSPNDLATFNVTMIGSLV